MQSGCHTQRLTIVDSVSIRTQNPTSHPLSHKHTYICTLVATYRTYYTLWLGFAWCWNLELKIQVALFLVTTLAIFWYTNSVSPLAGELADVAQGRAERAAAYENKKLISSVAIAFAQPQPQRQQQRSWMCWLCNIQTNLSALVLILVICYC